MSQLLQRVVTRAVVDDDDLVIAILEREDGSDARFDRGALVVRRHQDGDRRQRVALHQPLEILVLGESRLLPDLGDRENEEQRVERVENEEVHENGDVRRSHDSAQNVHAANSANA